MKKISTDFWQKMFFVGALWNISIGLISLLLTDFIIMMMFGKAPMTENLSAFINGTVPVVDNLHTLIFFRFFMIAVIIFGIGYYMGLAGSAGQSRCYLAWTGRQAYDLFYICLLLCAGTASLFSVLICSGDFVFSILFILFLYQTKDGIY